MRLQSKLLQAQQLSTLGRCFPNHTALLKGSKRLAACRQQSFHNTHMLLQQRSSAVALATATAGSNVQAAESQSNNKEAAVPQETKPQRPTERTQLPQELQDVTAILSVPNPEAPSGTTHVYVLGMSHVSRRSLHHIEQLILLVQPEVVVVELCKDRITGLVDRDAVEMQRSHCSRVAWTGLPKRKGWPSEQELLRLIRTRPGEAVSYQDIEEDPSRLLATGLFRSCRPVVNPPSRRGDFYPTFLQQQRQPVSDEEPAPEDGTDAGEGIVLKALRPIGGAEFILAPRQLPAVKEINVRVDSSLRDGPEVPAAALQDAAAAAVASQAAAKGKEVTPSVDLLMALRADMLDIAAAAGIDRTRVEVLFQGTESSLVEAILRAVPDGRDASVSGLESTAIGGEGEGIEPFRASPRLVEIGISMRVPLDKVAENLAPRPPPAALVPEEYSYDRAPCRTSWQRWNTDDDERVDALAADEAAPKPPTAGPVGGFAMVLSGLYARFQDAAGLAVGVDSGEAWRTAFRAAASVGAAQVVLGDRPSQITARRMGAAVLSSTAPTFLAACALSAAADYAAATGMLPDGAGPVAVLAGLAAVAASLAPIAGPLLEVRSLSKKDAADIEAAVEVKEPLQGGEGTLKLWGEDALLGWPGAMDPVINERDAFMARVISAAARGSSAEAPALIADMGADGVPIWRYTVGKNGPQGVCPLGEGDGTYAALPAVSAVVAVVGTAHVRGIVREWDVAAASENTELEPYLEY